MAVKQKIVQEKCQQILTELLKDEDNKYCVDCDAKGPRWASWNLGIFLCIRCAGIHRNLGVHISKVKSINLDSWTPEQVGYLQQMGNSKARAVYEANLPDSFRRPQMDSSLEAFVRAKYEQKKYIAKEWVAPPPPPPAFDIEEEKRKEKEKKKTKTVFKMQPNSSSPVDVQTNPLPRPHSNVTSTTINSEKVVLDSQAKKLSADLLGLDILSDPINEPGKSDVTSGSGFGSATATDDDDLFDAFVSAQPLPASNSVVNSKNSTDNDILNEEKEFFNQKVPEKTTLDKETILKLYESSSTYVNPMISSLNQGPIHQAPLAGGFMPPQNSMWPIAGNVATNPLTHNSAFGSANSMPMNVNPNLAQPQTHPVS